MEKKESARSQYTGGIWVCLGVAFLLCIFAPLDIFFTNKKEFWYDFGTLLPFALVSFAVLFAVLGIIYACLTKLHKTAGAVCCGVLTLVYLCTYIQGNFLTGYLPVLDGAPIDWGKLWMHRVESIVCWLVVAAVLVRVWAWCRKRESAGSLKFVRICGTGSLLLTMMLLVTLVSEAILYNGLEERVKRSNSMTNALAFSQDKNLVVVLLDAVDGDEMAKLLETDQEYKELFQDFTFYQNTLGVYPFTLYAVPYLIDGRPFLAGEEDWFSYVTNAYIESPFVQELWAQDYKVGLYETDLICNSDAYLQFDIVINSAHYISSAPDFWQYQRKLVCYRYLPFDLKRFHVAAPDEGSSLKAKGARFSNTAYYKFLNDTDVTYTNQNTFRFYHMEGAHAPFHLDAELQEVESSTYEAQLAGCKRILSTLFTKLKAAGVYDSTAIIVLSDHGCDKNAVDSEYGRQHPILFVKGIGEHADNMRLSMAPVSFADMQDAYRALLQGADSTAVFPAAAEADRRRIYYLYNFDDNMHLFEYEQTGYAGDQSGLVPTGVEYTTE